MNISDLGAPLTLEDVRKGVNFTVINLGVGFPIHCGTFTSEPYEQDGFTMVNATNMGTTADLSFPEDLADMGLVSDRWGYTPSHISTFQHPSSCECRMNQSG